MSVSSLLYWNDQLGKVVPNRLRLQWTITAAKTVSAAVANSASLVAFDAVASQAVIDALLGTTSEFALAAFDATAMGTDAFAAIVNMGGQAKKLLGCRASFYTGSNGLTSVKSGVASVTTLTASSLTAQCALGASGNLAARVILTGVDALTSGIIELELDWISK